MFYVMATLMEQQLLGNDWEPMILLTLAAAAFFGLVRGLESRVRVYEVLYWFLLIPLLVILVIACAGIEPNAWTPVAASTLPNFIKSSYVSFLFFSGASLYVLFLKSCQKKEQAYAGTRHELLVVLCLNLVIYLILLGVFRTELLAHRRRPVIDLMAGVKLPGNFLERQDALMVGIWFFCLFAFLDSMLYYAVEDTGIGIRKEDQKILFDAFQRVEIDRNRYVEGTGLGLTISQNLVNMMGGVIEVESEYGKGSKFYFTIEQTIVDPTPMSAVNYEQQKSGVIEKEAESLFIAPGAYILLVDDNDLNLVVAKDLLKPLQMQIDTAENGMQAVDLVQRNHYDLVLMDHMMPVMDGIVATKTIRELPDEKYKKLPIIALTANAMVDARKEFLNAGMNGFVAKPIDFTRICNQLKLWLPKELVQEVSGEEAKQLLMNDISDSEIQPENPETGFSFEEGVKHCGSKAALMKTIRIFYRTIDSKANKIEQCLKEGLISDYVIEVHALKSSALLIGAVPLSEAAKELEDYGKQGKTEVLEEKTPDVLTLYRDLKNILRPYAEKEEDAKKEFSDGEWITALQQIHQCIEQFDLDGVDQIMEQLEEYQVPECIRESMDQLRVYVADVSMEEIMELTDTMTGLLRD